MSLIVRVYPFYRGSKWEYSYKRRPGYLREVPGALRVGGELRLLGVFYQNNVRDSQLAVTLN